MFSLKNNCIHYLDHDFAYYYISGRSISSVEADLCQISLYFLIIMSFASFEMWFT